MRKIYQGVGLNPRIILSVRTASISTFNLVTLDYSGQLAQLSLLIPTSLLETSDHDGGFCVIHSPVPTLDH